MPYRRLLSLGRVLAITSTLFLADHSPPYDCLPLRGTSAKSDSISHPCDTVVIGKFQILPGISCYPKPSLVPRKRVFFNLFSPDL